MTIHISARTVAPVLRRLGLADAPALLALQDEATRGLPPRYFLAKDDAALRPYLDGTKGVAYGIGDGATLRASALLRLPDAAHPNPVGHPPFPIVPAAEWPCHAAFLENAMVHPDWRGRFYQRALLELRLAHAAACGMRWACAASHLDNLASWSNLLAGGFAIVGLIEPDGQPVIGLLYAIGASHLATDPHDSVMVAAREKAQHLAALRDGFIGVRRAGDTVIYRRRIA
jgi:hypothetical protein